MLVKPLQASASCGGAREPKENGGMIPVRGEVWVLLGTGDRIGTPLELGGNRVLWF